MLLPFRTALIAAGVFVNLLAGLHRIRLVRELDRDETAHSRPSIQPVAIAFFLALLGLAIGIYLVSFQSSTRPEARNIEEISGDTNRRQRHRQEELCYDSRAARLKTRQLMPI